ncbi:MAG TPA: hypothetical protein PLH57_06735, partial [Oligoflexia bacterium]|nr:hypothetical protein [Oligoflexia bacterium]
FVLFPDPWPKARHHERRLNYFRSSSLCFTPVKQRLRRSPSPRWYRLARKWPLRFLRFWVTC